MAMKTYFTFPRTGALPLDGLVSYPVHLLGNGFYLSAEIQLVYSIAPADWVLIETGPEVLKSYSGGHLVPYKKIMLAYFI